MTNYITYEHTDLKMDLHAYYTCETYPMICTKKIKIKVTLENKFLCKLK